MSDEGNRLPVARSQGRCKIHVLARQRSEDAMTVLAAIMGDAAAAPIARITAANSILAWIYAGGGAGLWCNNKGNLARTAVGVEWSGALQPVRDPD